MIQVKVHFKNGIGICYLESEIDPNQAGQYKYAGYLHLKCAKIPLAQVISEEIIYNDQTKKDLPGEIRWT